MSLVGQESMKFTTYVPLKKKCIVKHAKFDKNLSSSFEEVKNVPLLTQDARRRTTTNCNWSLDSLNYI